MNEKLQHIVHVPYFPIYSEVRNLLKIWKDTNKAAVLQMLNAVYAERGTPQDPADWTNPDDWIGKLLTGGHKELARRTWEESGRTANPRHLFGSYIFINRYELLTPDAAGTYHLTATGTGFLSDDPATVRKIDEAEGLPQLLAILAAHSPAKRGDLLADWGDLLRTRSGFTAESSIMDTLRRRILNLVERGFITRDGNTYTITSTGIAYAAKTSAPADQLPHQQALNAIKAHNDAQQVALRERLGAMHPYQFEHLVKDLLDAMGYDDVVVTKQSGDKGVDVVANFEFGITEVREVVQVKRHQGSMARGPTLDQLRGALPYHKAIRGTIITLGKFAQGCKDAALYPGAAPITLIDGDKLIELLLEHRSRRQERPAHPGGD